MLVIAAMNLGILTILFFIVGMIKPHWALFFMDKPTRFIVMMISIVGIMVSFTMYGEGHRRGSTPDQWVKVPMVKQSRVKVKPKPPVDAPVPEVKEDSAAVSTAPVVSPAPVSTPAPAPVQNPPVSAVPSTEPAVSAEPPAAAPAPVQEPAKK